MKFLKYIFTNAGVAVNNDHVLPATFNLSDNNYSFKITPSVSTLYWRFGFALSKERDFIFNPNQGRYNNRDLKYIEVDVGDRPTGQWQSEDIIALGSYYIDGFNGQPKLKPGYIPNTEVEITIRLNPSRQIVATYATQGVSDYTTFPIGEYCYFRVFAWADFIEFTIESEITSESKSVETIISPQLAITDNFPPVIEVIELAKEIADLLKLLKDETGNMFGIFGRWGRGKTFLWKEIQKKLNPDGKRNSIRYAYAEFHAWKYQDTPASWAYLYEILADRYFCPDRLIEYKKEIKLKYKEDFKNLPFWTPLRFISKLIFIWLAEPLIKFALRIKLNYTRLGLTPLLAFLIPFLLYAIWLFIPLKIKLEYSWDVISKIIKSLGLIVFIKIIYLYYSYKTKAKDLLNKYSAKASFEMHLGLQAEIQKELMFLLKAWISQSDIPKKRVVLFVDDIDRCSEDKIIQVVDALKVMLENFNISRRLIVVVALDERVLKMAIRFKYQKFSLNSLTTGNDAATNEDNKLNDFSKNLTKEYIDKLFIGGVRLGELSIDERLIILDGITKDKVSNIIEPTSVNPDNLIATPITPDPTVESDSDIDFEYIATTIDEPEISKAEITISEFKMLQDVAAKFGEITPRALRIYYYRYLLAKKIIGYKFKSNRLFYKTWSRMNSPNKMLAVLIFHYSTNTTTTPIEKESEELDNKSQEELIPVIIDSFWNFPSVKVHLYKQLLKVVEMVVPY